ncbi:MAG: hypothetical protein ACE5H9_07850 [Anaerolineae bacterium]
MKKALTLAIAMLLLIVPIAGAQGPAGSGIDGGHPDFSVDVMVSQGYWLSRDHFGPFVMGSGMGVPFMPPMDMIMAAMPMIAQNPNDPVMIPQNMAPLQAIYASGSPQLVNNPLDFEPLDFEGLRLDPASFDETVGVRGQAETMLKESQWAHNFANSHFGTPDGDFGAQQRFIGIMVNMLAQMQAQYAMQNLMGDDGLFHDSDGALDYTANWVMLHTISDLSVLSGGNVTPRYANPDMHGMFEGAATQLFRTLESRTPESTEESTAAIRALVYRAWTADDGSVRDAALAKATAIADGLVDLNSDDVVENATAIAGLVSLYSVTGDTRYSDAADKLYQVLANDFNAQHGVFNSKSVYNVNDLAWLIGGLNSLVQHGNTATQGEATSMLLAFYESSINLSGIQLSAPPGKNGAMAGPWEQNLPGEIYYHPVNTPPPPMSGMLPVPAEEITWDGSAWSVTSNRFVTGGAMHLANELNWFGPHLGSIPFPPLQASAPATLPVSGADRVGLSAWGTIALLLGGTVLVGAGVALRRRQAAAG